MLKAIGDMNMYPVRHKVVVQRDSGLGANTDIMCPEDAKSMYALTDRCLVVGTSVLIYDRMVHL